MTQKSILWTVAKEQRLSELWEAGKTAAEIAHDLKCCTRNAVLGKAHRMNLPARVERVSPEELQRRREKRRDIDAARRKYRHENQRYARFIGKFAKSKSEKPQPKDAPMFTGSLDVTFNDLRDFSGVAANQCRFPTGEFFCGVETPAGKSWCGHHHRIVFGYVPQFSDAERQRRAGQMRRIGVIPAAIACSDIEAGA